MKNYFNSPFKGKELRKQVTNPNISVGRYSYYSGYYHYHNFEECVRYLSHDRTDVDHLKIGSFCSIGSGASFIMAGNQGHQSDWISTFPFHYFSEFSGKSRDGYTPAGDTIIKNDVWIGSEATIMPGTVIENGAIIGSRTVVTKSIPAYSVIAGNPGRLIKMRFSDHDIMLLQKISWWNWPLCHIKAVLPILCSQNIHDLYIYWQNHYREL